MADLELRPYQLANEAAPPDDACIIIDNATYTDPKQTTKAQLFADEIAARTTADTNIKTGAGLDTNGAFVSAPTSTYLTPASFLAAGYSESLYNGILLLDQAIRTLATTGELNVIVTLTNAELLALNATPVTKLAAPAAGNFYHISEVVAKNNFGTVAYTCDAAGIIFRFVGGGSDAIVTLTQAFVQSAAVIRTKFLVEQHDILPAVAIEAFAPNADPTNGDGTISVIFRYQILPDFTGISASTSPCCIIPVTGTFTDADLDPAGNFVIHHQLNTTKVHVFILDGSTPRKGSQYDFTCGNAAGADQSNYVTVPIGTCGGLTWTYMVVAVQ